MFKQLAWLMLGAFAIGTESFVIAGILPDLSSDLGVTIAQAGYLVVAFSLTYGIATPVLAVVTASWPRERVLRVAMAGFTVGNALAASTGSFAGLLMARVALALCAGVFMGTASAYAAASAPPERRGRALSMVYLGMNAATVLGVPMGALVGHTFGWRSTFALTAAVAGLAWAGLCLPRAPQPVQAVPGIGARVRLAARPAVSLGLLTTLLCFTGVFAMYTYVAPLLADTAGLGGSALAVVLLLFGLAGSFGNVVGGHLADRHGPMPVIGAVLAALVLFYGAMAMTARHASHDGAGWVLAGLFVVSGFVNWQFAPSQQLTFVQRAPDAISVALSLNASALYLGISLGAWIGSLVVDAGGLRSMGWVSAACMVLALLTARWGNHLSSSKGVINGTRQASA